MKTIFDELKQEVKNWWVSLILGILYVAVALGLMFFPFNGYAALSILFSVSMLVSGLLEIAFAVSNRQRVSSWGWYLAGGVIDMILGLYLVTYPVLSMEVIPFIIAFWLMFRGFSSVGYAMDLKGTEQKSGAGILHSASLPSYARLLSCGNRRSELSTPFI